MKKQEDEILYVTGLKRDHDLSAKELQQCPHRELLDQIDVLSFDAPVSFLVGENGAGKSTIIESVAHYLRLNIEGGSRNTILDTPKTHATLADYCRLEKTLFTPKDSYFYRSESYFNLMDTLDKDPEDGGSSAQYFGEKLHEVSRGEGFLDIIEGRLFGQGIYLFDEPESSLSLHMQLRFLQRIHELVKCDSQFIIATHSPLLLIYPKAAIYQLGKDGIERVALEETEVFSTWMAVLTRRDLVIEELFSGE